MNIEAILIAILVLAILASLSGAGAAPTSQIRLWRHERRAFELAMTEAYLRGLLTRTVQ